MKTVCQQKDMMDKVDKPFVYYSQKILEISKTNISLISKIYKELLLVHKNTTNQNKEKQWAKDVNKHFTKEKTQKKANKMKI